MSTNKIAVVKIEPDGIPLPARIDDDLLALSNAVNINWKGEPHKEFESFEIIEIKDNINIISSPKGEERSLPITRTIGHLKFYGIMYIVKMNGYELVSMSDKEVVEYCRKFLFKDISLEDLGLSSSGNSKRVNTTDRNESSGGRLEITFDEW